MMPLKNTIPFTAALLLIALSSATAASCDNTDGTIASTYLSCVPKILSANHPSVSSASNKNCINHLDLQKATDICRDEADCTGFWLYDNGRTCFKSTYNKVFTRVIPLGKMYSCEKKKKEAVSVTPSAGQMPSTIDVSNIASGMPFTVKWDMKIDTVNNAAVDCDDYLTDTVQSGKFMINPPGGTDVSLCFFLTLTSLLLTTY